MAMPGWVGVGVTIPVVAVPVLVAVGFIVEVGDDDEAAIPTQT